MRGQIYRRTFDFLFSAFFLSRYTPTPLHGTPLRPHVTVPEHAPMQLQGLLPLHR